MPRHTRFPGTADERGDDFGRPALRRQQQPRPESRVAVAVVAMPGRIANHPAGHVGKRTGAKATAVPAQSADSETEDEQGTRGEISR